MAAIKFVLLFALAFVACQGEAKQVVAVQANPKIWDLAPIIKDLIDIVNKIIAKVHEGIDEIEPIVNELVALLPPKTGQDVTDLIAQLKSLLAQLETEIQHVVDTINSAITSLDSIKSCSDPESDALKEIVDTAIEGCDGVLHDAITANQDGVNDLINGVKEDLATLKSLFDDNVAAGLKCLTLGNSDSCNCLSTVRDDVVNGVVALGANVVLHLTLLQDVVINGVIPQVIDGATPIVNKALADAQPHIDNVCSCVASS